MIRVGQIAAFLFIEVDSPKNAILLVVDSLEGIHKGAKLNWSRHRGVKTTLPLGLTIEPVVTKGAIFAIIP